MLEVLFNTGMEQKEFDLKVDELAETQPVLFDYFAEIELHHGKITAYYLVSLYFLIKAALEVQELENNV